MSEQQDKPPPQHTPFWREQHTHSGVALLAMLVILMKAAGIAPEVITRDVAEGVAAVGALAAAAKIALRG